MKGYKALYADWTSMNAFKWEVGKTYKLDGKLDVCNSGFHYYKKLADAVRMSRVPFGMIKYKVPGLDNLEVTNFAYDIEHTYIVEVEALGEIQKYLHVSATDEIRIVRELSVKEVFSITNTQVSNYGFNNTGDCNYGSRNAGYFNFGHQNTETLISVLGILMTTISGITMSDSITLDPVTPAHVILGTSTVVYAVREIIFRWDLYSVLIIMSYSMLNEKLESLIK